MKHDSLGGKVHGLSSLVLCFLRFFAAFFDMIRMWIVLETFGLMVSNRKQKQNQKNIEKRGPCKAIHARVVIMLA